MNAHISSIQPHFPDNESFRRLGFHLRELKKDMVALTRDAEMLSIITPTSSQAFRDLRAGTNNLMIGIEHDIFHHLSEAIELAHHITKKKSLSELLEKITSLQTEFNSENCSLLSDRQAENPSKLIIGLQNLTLDIRQALKNINYTPWNKEGVNQDLEQLENCLKQLTKILVDQALPCARNLYLQAFRLHQITDEFSAIEEAYWKKLSTPLRTENYIESDSFNICPHCGAKLNSDDRTFDGFYCESCRTRWIQST